MKHRLALQFAAFSLCAASHATVLHVPSEYATIQAAFENVHTADTVLVASGLYAEALVSPVVSFSLIGESAEDTLRPIVDPSSLADPTSLSCLIWNGITCHIENFVFRNGAEMYPRPFANDGGAILHCYVAEIINCMFDSTNAGLYLWGTTDLTLDHCDFKSCLSATVGGGRSLFIAANCLFERHGIMPDHGSQFINCVFDSMSRYVMIPVGDLYLESCLFQNQYSPDWSTINASNVSPTIRNCIFKNCLINRNVIFIQRNCTEDMLFDNNLFENISTSSDIGNVGINWGCNQSSTPALVTIRDNTFVNSTGQGFAKCIGASSSDHSTILLERNRFINIGGDSPTVHMTNANVIARDNIFINTTYALSTGRHAEASYNYWGDPTGPFNATSNPTGLGDEVSDSVMFWPWHGDTLLDTPPPIELPEKFSFSVYPNPFNSATRISLSTPTSFIASIELVNILGQRVREIHRGPLFGQQEFNLNADNLPSGIYFLTVRDIVQNSVNSFQKIVLLK